MILIWICCELFVNLEREIAEKEAKKKGNAALSALMKHINLSAKSTKEEGFTIGVGEFSRMIKFNWLISHSFSLSSKANTAYLLNPDEI